MMASCSVFDERIEHLLRHDQRLQHEPVGLAAAGGEALGDLFEAERDQAGRGRIGGVAGAGLHRGVKLVRRRRQRGGARRLQQHVELTAAAANLHALGIVRIDDGLAPAGAAAGLPDPRHHDDALLGEERAELLTDRRLLPRRALLVGADQARHQADVELGRTRRRRRRSDRGSCRARLCGRRRTAPPSSSATSSDRPARRSTCRCASPARRRTCGTGGRGNHLRFRCRRGTDGKS